jgi:O-methyltransferase involved in polyketide biosynthesis
MLDGQPSRTAMGTAAHRATHQTVEHGGVFRDPLHAAGFARCEDFTVRRLAERHWGAAAVAARARAGQPFSDRGGHVLFAATA